MIYFALGLVAVLVVFWMIARLEGEQASLMAGNQERSHLWQVRNVLGSNLARLAIDLSILAESGALERYLASPSPESLEALTERLRSFAEDKRFYDRIAYLDPAGRELAGHEPMDRVAADDSQQGKYRDHVQESLNLPQGDLAVWVSDDGKSDPAKPESAVLHLATPVFDNAGERKGMVLLACRTSHLLDRLLGSLAENDADRLLIVDHHGNPVRVPAVKEHGELFHAVDQPALWQAIQNRPGGQVPATGGLFTFVRLKPAMEIRKEAKAEIIQEMDDREQAEAYAWYVISFIPVPERAALAIFRQKGNFLFLPLIFAILVAGALHLAINRANKERSDRAVELLSTAIEQSPAAAVITDSNGLIQYANPKFLAMSGYTKEEIVGKNPRLFKSGETPAEVYRDLWHTIRAGRVWTGEFLNRRKDNVHYMVAAKISPILGKSGAINGYLAIQEDITETRRLQQQLERLATVDGLTGTYNRSHFMHLLGQELRREERYGQPLCLLVFDLDHFKAINDTYGHQAGDRVLEEFAPLVASILRDTDIFGRLGGEEFGVILLQTDYEGANLLAERLRMAIEKMRVTCESRVIQVTASIGGTEWERHDRKVEVILNRADNALYEAKRRGRNQVCFKFAADEREN